MGNSARSDFLFADTSFLTGAGSALNIAGNFYSFNSSKSVEQADFEAIRSDWRMVGKDLADSMTMADANPAECLKK